jgi:hypothetical protein
MHIVCLDKDESLVCKTVHILAICKLGRASLVRSLQEAAIPIPLVSLQLIHCRQASPGGHHVASLQRQSVGMSGLAYVLELTSDAASPRLCYHEQAARSIYVHDQLNFLYPIDSRAGGLMMCHVQQLYIYYGHRVHRWFSAG